LKSLPSSIGEEYTLFACISGRLPAKRQKAAKYQSFFGEYQKSYISRFTHIYHRQLKIIILHSLPARTSFI
jgi:hypothetical protein